MATESVDAGDDHKMLVHPAKSPQAQTQQAPPPAPVQLQPQTQPPQHVKPSPYSRILPRPDNMPVQQALVTRLRKTPPGGSGGLPGSSAAATPPKRSRAGKPKVRTGCQTCKLRHVKCDERKPSCMRCQSVNIPCQGYVEPAARRSSKRSAAAAAAATAAEAGHWTGRSPSSPAGIDSGIRPASVRPSQPLLLPRNASATTPVPISPATTSVSVASSSVPPPSPVPVSSSSALAAVSPSASSSLSPSFSSASPPTFSPTFASDPSLSLSLSLSPSAPSAPPASSSFSSSSPFSLPPPTLYRSLSLKPRIAPEDVVYFDYFRNQVTSNRAGFYTTSIWSRLVAGEALPDDCIHHSILAIGAFMRSMSEAAPGSSFFPESSSPLLTSSSSSASSACSPVVPSHSFPDSLPQQQDLLPVLLDSTILNQHHHVALRHHVKAVTSFRQKLQQMAWTSPTAVVTTTLLLVVFELLQGNRVAANKLIDSATALLQGFHMLPGAGGSAENSPASLQEQLQQQLLEQPPLGASLVHRDVHSSDHEFRDMEWVLPIISVMNQLSHLGRRLPPQHRLPDPSSAAELDIDFQFPEPDHDSISKLFICWGHFFTHCIIFLRQGIYTGLQTSSGAAATPISSPSSASNFSSSTTPGSSSASPPAAVPGSASSMASPPAPSSDAFLALVPRQEAFLGHLCRWQVILSEYAASDRIDSMGKNALRLARVHWLLLHVTVRCCLDPTQVLYDRHAADLADLCAQCVGLIRDNLSRERPTSVLLGEGLILPLSAVVRFCRDHDTRMTAAAVIRQIPASMIAWDAPGMLDGLLGAVLLEERGRHQSSGFVPPASRWFWLEDDETPGSLGTPRKDFNVYQCLVPDENGEAVYKKVRRRPALWAEICQTAGCTKNHAAF